MNHYNFVSEKYWKANLSVRRKKWQAQRYCLAGLPCVDDEDHGHGDGGGCGDDGDNYDAKDVLPR